jgi:carboxypeptidase PM20D1
MATAADLPPEVEALRAVLRLATVSHPDPAAVDASLFDELHAELARRFPLLHEHLELTRVGSHALLFHWPGRSAARPVVLMGHLDVVPVDEDAPWQHPPFSAEVVDGRVWARGTLDDKGQVVAVCAAVERHLAAGHVPAQDVWLSFGCDEEVSGTAAGLAVDELTRRGVRPWFVLDEGGAVASQAFPGVSAPLAVIGVSEKGVTSVELSVEGRGGHASTPARMAPTVRIARAVQRVERSPFPARLSDTTVELFRRMAPHASAPLRPLLAGADRMRPVVARALVAAGPEPAAMVRTTVAVTTLTGSTALNVIATSATAGLNLRIMTGESVAGAVEHIRRAVRDDEVRIRVIEASEPSPVSPVDDEAFDLIAATVGEVFPDAVPTPYVMMAATDARRFTGICERVYRFAPFRMTKAQRESIHSYDEHLGVEDFLDGIRWYHRLIEGLPG